MTMMAMTTGLLLMPAAMLHGVLRLSRTGTQPIASPNYWYALPYLSLLELSFFKFSSAKLYIAEFTLANYSTVLTDPFYLLLMLRTLGLGVLVTVITLLLGYPLALMIVRSPPRTKTLVIAIALSPLLINLVVRSYAWLVLLGDTGIINSWLKAIGLISRRCRSTATGSR
jgi:ABC-type spermidine/putrescine transport system permease subunit I